MQTHNSFVDSVVRSFTDTGTESDLVRDFLIFFARFEYALKRAGYFTGNEKEAKANWNCFAVRLRNRFDSTDSDAFNKAIQFLLDHPPKKEVVLDGKVDRQPPQRGDGEGRSDYVLRLVRIVRNNLFHGGKFPVPIGPMAESSRDRALLQNCLTILAECAQMDSDVNRWFELDV